MDPLAIDETALEARVAEVPAWYHTLDLGGVTTPGYFDLRGIVDDLPWPDLTGKRCLDVATFDGFYAFEMERRGAAEVVALDLDDAVDIDWLPRLRPQGLERGDEPVGIGFRVAHEALGSSVKRVVCSVYDADPDELGHFDVVVCGALMEHLRDPLRALSAIRRMTQGHFLSIERVDMLTSLVWRRPLVSLVARRRSWSLPNMAGHRRMLDVVGFDVQRQVKVPMVHGPVWQHLGEADHTHRRTTRARRQRMLARLMSGSPEAVTSAILATPAHLDD